PQSVAHRHAIRAAHGVVGVRENLLVGWRGLCCRRNRMVLVLHHLCAGRAAEPGPALVAASTGAFRAAWACKDLAQRNPLAAARLSPHIGLFGTFQAALRENLPALPAVPFERLAVTAVLAP